MSTLWVKEYKNTITLAILGRYLFCQLQNLTFFTWAIKYIAALSLSTISITIQVIYIFIAFPCPRSFAPSTCNRTSTPLAPRHPYASFWKGILFIILFIFGQLKQSTKRLLSSFYTWSCFLEIYVIFMTCICISVSWWAFKTLINIKQNAETRKNTMCNIV